MASSTMLQRIRSIIDIICPLKETEISVDKKHVLPGQEDASKAVASDILTLLTTASRDDENLRLKTQAQINVTGLRETIAKYVLAGLEGLIKNGAKVGGAMADAIDRATEEAIGFAKEHPVYFTLIAIGVLAILSPWILEILGFARLGPVRGSWAAFWQSKYAGYIPKGSLFSYLQRLGMTWRVTPVVS